MSWSQRQGRYVDDLLVSTPTEESAILLANQGGTYNIAGF